MIFYVMCQFLYSEQGTLMALSLFSVVKGGQEMNLKLSDPWSAKKDHKYWGTGHKKTQSTYCGAVLYIISKPYNGCDKIWFVKSQ